MNGLTVQQQRDQNTETLGYIKGKIDGIVKQLNTNDIKTEENTKGIQKNAIKINTISTKMYVIAGLIILASPIVAMLLSN